MANKINSRKNALKMATWDLTLLWYAKAVGVMKTRPATDPTSWRFQAAIHGFTLDPNEDPEAAANWAAWTKGGALPSKTVQKTFWLQCQHGTWYFLPWHRMYLGYFEKIVRQTIAGLGGPADWALPYWNYNEGVTSGKFPEAFTKSKLPDGTPNPLFEPLRDAGNDGKPFLPASDVSLKSAFKEHVFAGGAHGGSTGFGGAVTNFQHGGGAFGMLELTPHNQVHSDIGGLMGDPTTAGYDPIFYLHHANIDRLWEVWLQASPANTNPAATSKWQTFTFKFNDELATTQTLTPHDVLDTKTTPFYYEYEDISVPASAGVVAPAAAPTARAAAKKAAEPMAEESIPEMIGASSQATPLASEAKTLGVRLFPVSGPVRALGAADAHFREAYLHVENVRGQGRPASYDVYLNIPEGTGAPSEKLRAGTIASFGLAHASVATERHPGSGLRFTFNITETVNLLKAENLWDPKMLKVTFVPRRKLAKGQSLEVGRVSLYYK